MRKKVAITSIVSYLFLAVAIGMFYLAGINGIITKPIPVENGLVLNTYNFYWHLMSILSGSIFDTNKDVGVWSWVTIAIFLLLIVVLFINNKNFLRRLWGLEYIQLTVLAIVTVFFITTLRYFSISQQFNSYTSIGGKIGLVLWLVAAAIYILLQLTAYCFIIFNNEKVEEKEECTCCKHDHEQTHEEDHEEEAQPEEEAPEETNEQEETSTDVQEDEQKEDEPEVSEVTEENEELPEEETEEESEENNDTDARLNATKVKRVKITFEERLEKADPTLVSKYHEIRDEIMSYGIKSRVSSSGDTFRLHTIKYMKIVVAGKKLKLYMKLNPRKYDGTTIPHGDASTKQLYADIPMVFKVGSDLSVKRAKTLISDMMAENGIEKKKTRKPKADAEVQSQEANN